MKIETLTTALYLIVLVLFSSCEKDDDIISNPQNTNENELITTMKLIVQESGNPSNEQVFVSKDLDGDGPGLLTVDTIRLVNGITYKMEILLLDESKNPVDTISKEVEEEGDEHLFIFTPSGVNVTITRTDVDENGVVIGLEANLTANAVTTNKSGKVKIALKHQGEDKTKDPNVTVNEAVGSTDIEVYFPIIIQ